MVDIMNCHNEDHSDCRHLVEHSGYWRCKIHGDIIITQPEIQGCHYYESPGEHSLRVALQENRDDFDKKILQSDIARHELLVESIRDGILYAVVAFTALALLVWWTS